MNLDKLIDSINRMVSENKLCSYDSEDNVDVFDLMRPMDCSRKSIDITSAFSMCMMGDRERAMRRTGYRVLDALCKNEDVNGTAVFNIMEDEDTYNLLFNTRTKTNVLSREALCNPAVISYLRGKRLFVTLTRTERGVKISMMNRACTAICTIAKIDENGHYFSAVSRSDNLEHKRFVVNNYDSRCDLQLKEVELIEAMVEYEAERLAMMSNLADELDANITAGGLVLGESTLLNCSDKVSPIVPMPLLSEFDMEEDDMSLGFPWDSRYNSCPMIYDMSELPFLNAIDIWDVIEDHEIAGSEGDDDLRALDKSRLNPNDFHRWEGRGTLKKIIYCGWNIRRIIMSMGHYSHYGVSKIRELLKQQETKQLGKNYHKWYEWSINECDILSGTNAKADFKVPTKEDLTYMCLALVFWHNRALYGDQVTEAKELFRLCYKETTMGSYHPNVYSARLDLGIKFKMIELGVNVSRVLTVSPDRTLPLNCSALYHLADNWTLVERGVAAWELDELGERMGSVVRVEDV